MSNADSVPGPRNLDRELDSISEHWFPRVVARVNDHYLKVAKVQGELTWHAHDLQDELFLILKGRLRIQLEGDGDAPGDATGEVPAGAAGGAPENVREVVLEEGDVWVVPAGTRHNPVAEEECWLALVEPVDTDHTGGEPSSRRRSIDDQLGR